jgi:hypothetical protein
VVLADEVLHIHGSPTHLLAVHVADQRLFTDGIFLAHAASLRQTFYFTTRKFGEFLHSFRTRTSLVRQRVGQDLAPVLRLENSGNDHQALVQQQAALSIRSPQ